MKIFKEINAIQLKNGSFVRYFQYSQGYFSYSTSEDIFEAIDIPEECVKWFHPRECPYTHEMKDMELEGCKVVHIKFEAGKTDGWDTITALKS